MNLLPCIATDKYPVANRCKQAYLIYELLTNLRYKFELNKENNKYTFLRQLYFAEIYICNVLNSEAGDPSGHPLAVVFYHTHSPVVTPLASVTGEVSFWLRVSMIGEGGP